MTSKSKEELKKELEALQDQACIVHEELTELEDEIEKIEKMLNKEKV